MSRAGSRGAIVVFAKAPRAGEVKTRLTPFLSPEQAADLYSCMLGDVLEATSRFCVTRQLTATLAIHPWEARREIAPKVPQNVRIVAQRGSGLSERMACAAAEAAAQGHSRILLRGSDSPLLSASVLAQALTLLEEHDLAVSPDADGGYSLIALRRPSEGLFEHAMSTSSVLHDTLANARRMGLRCAELHAGSDIDTPDDLRRFARACREASARALAPRTATCVARLELATKLDALAGSAS